MDIADIEQLVSMLRDAGISELTVSANGAKVSLRKPLVRAAAPAPPERMADAKPMPEPSPAEETASSPGTYIVAPMVGIFHTIDILSMTGAAVKAGQVVGAIESMKLMNDVVSQHEGVIAEILVEGGMPVEFGQHLFRLE